MTTPFFRSGFNYDRDAASVDSGLECPEETLAQQSFRDESDINTIVRRFGVTGELPSNVQMPVSGDFTGVGDFHSAMNLVRQAEESFLLLPAEVRRRFDNDPGQVMRFLDDPANRAEAEKLGLVAPPAAPPEPLSVRVVEPAPGTPGAGAAAGT